MVNTPLLYGGALGSIPNGTITRKEGDYVEEDNWWTEA